MSKLYHRVHPKNTRNMTKRVVVRTGSEGNKNDPWYYTEYYLNGITLHLGLTAWVKDTVTGKEINFSDIFPTFRKKFGRKDIDKAESLAYKFLQRTFEEWTHVLISNVDRYQNSLKADPYYNYYRSNI